MTELEAAHGRDSDGRATWSHHPREVGSGLLVAAAFAVAVGIGLVAAFAPATVLLGVLAVAVLGVLVTRVEWAAALVVAAAPFESYLGLVNGNVVKALAVVLVVGWLGRRLLHPDPASLHHPVAGAALAVLVTLLAATALHPTPAGPTVLVRYLGFLAVTVVLLDLFRRGLPVVRIARVYVVACTVAAGFGIVTFFVTSEARVGGPLEDPNDLAFFLLAALPFAVALRRSGRRTWAYDLATLVLLAGLAGSLSRGAILGLGVMVVFALAWRQVRPSAVVALVVLATVGLGAVALAVPEQVDESLSDKSNVAGQNVDDRLALWRVAGEMTWRNPVLGVGPGGYSTRFEEYAEVAMVSTSHDLDVAHNLYLEASSELGLLGLAALLALMGGGFGCALRRWRHDGVPVAAATTCAFVGTAAAAMFISEQYFLPLWLLSAFGAGLWPVPDREAPR